MFNNIIIHLIKSLYYYDVVCFKIISMFWFCIGISIKSWSWSSRDHKILTFTLDNQSEHSGKINIPLQLQLLFHWIVNFIKAMSSLSATPQWLIIVYIYLSRFIKNIYVSKTFYLCQVTCWFWNPERLCRNVSTCRSGWRAWQSYYHQPSADVSVPTQKNLKFGVNNFLSFFCLFVERNEYSARAHSFKLSKSDIKDIYNVTLFLFHT